ncbi:YbaB/EbfC family nucleoid-associated protein [Glycomyces harbinensis]|uniref:YbaB/EbfC DNA-binding family protein n=1 Tax=Glycomyces harbinensis TaxID=58114 RepID=A0A1G6SZ46_9ACTN|nr:YbaB/EbfC family nucleoid-associated protein [Glycomyces harbinensis]SDD22078.1 YbaB/EbfC DNA-binding family protein [Glycomyces harbinensis]
MTNGPNPSNIGDALGQALDAVKAGQQAQEAIADKTTQAEAADGRVIATASLNGKVTVEITNVRAYRLEPAQLAAEITRAVNEALDAARDQAAAPADVDLGELSAKLEEIQQQSAKQLQSFMSSLTETHAGVLRAASEGRERP